MPRVPRGLGRRTGVGYGRLVLVGDGRPLFSRSIFGGFLSLMFECSVNMFLHKD